MVAGPAFFVRRLFRFALSSCPADRFTKGYLDRRNFRAALLLFGYCNARIF